MKEQKILIVPTILALSLWIFGEIFQKLDGEVACIKGFEMGYWKMDYIAWQWSTSLGWRDLLGLWVLLALALPILDGFVFFWFNSPSSVFSLFVRSAGSGKVGSRLSRRTACKGTLCLSRTMWIDVVGPSLSPFDFKKCAFYKKAPLEVWFWRKCRDDNVSQGGRSATVLNELNWWFDECELDREVRWCRLDLRISTPLIFRRWADDSFARCSEGSKHCRRPAQSNHWRALSFCDVSEVFFDGQFVDE